VQDEQIAIVEQKGRRFVAYLLGQSRLRGEGATQEEALEKLGATVHKHLQKSRNSDPLVQSLIIRSRQQ
jgi:hypothetical protein